MKHMFLVLMVLLFLGSVFATGYFAVSHSSKLVAGQENEYILRVSDKTTGDPVASAGVSLVFEDKELASYETDGSGEVIFNLFPESEGRVEFRVSHENYNDYVVVQKVLAPAEGFVDEEAGDEGADEGSADNTQPTTGLITEDKPSEGAALWVFLFGIVAVALVVFGYYFYTRDDEEGLESEDLSLEERYDAVKNELEEF